MKNVSRLSIAAKVILKWGVTTKAGTKLTLQECRKRANFRYTDHVVGLTTWTFADKSQVVYCNKTNIFTIR